MCVFKDIERQLRKYLKEKKKCFSLTNCVSDSSHLPFWSSFCWLGSAFYIFVRIYFGSCCAPRLLNNWRKELHFVTTHFLCKIGRIRIAGFFCIFLTPFNRLIMRFFSLTNSVDRKIMGCVPKFFNGFSIDSKIVSSHLFFFYRKRGRNWNEIKCQPILLVNLEKFKKSFQNIVWKSESASQCARADVCWVWGDRVNKPTHSPDITFWNACFFGQQLEHLLLTRHLYSARGLGC